MLEHVANADLRELRQLRCRFLKRCDVGDLAQRNPKHLAAFPKPEDPKFLRADWLRAGRAMKISDHLIVTATGAADVWLSQPDENLRIGKQARCADARDGDQMQERIFPEREFLNCRTEIRFPIGPFFGKLRERSFDLPGIE